MNRRFGLDLFWNYGSILVLGIGGLLVNYFVALRYGADGLGVFNQLYSVYVILSQLAVGGLHHSALKHVAEESAHGGHPPAAGTAMVLACALGAVIAFATWLLSPWVGTAMGSTATGNGLAWAAPGLLFFSANKTALAIHNGLRHMRLFAAYQTLRFVAVAGVVGVVGFVKAPVETLGLAFTVSEAALFLVMLPELRRHCAFFGPHSREWAGRHAVFAGKGVAAGLMTEANIRIDILMLGLFTTDAVVGVYSFASTIAEGFIQLLIVMRTNVNPLLVRLVKDRDQSGLDTLMHSVRRTLVPGSAALALLGMALFPLFLHLFYAGGEFDGAWAVLGILLIGLVLYSPWLPFDFILLQGGLPGWHSYLLAAMVATNTGLNLLLIPMLGANGAAVATALSYVLAAFYLYLLSSHKLGMSLLPKRLRRKASP